MKSEIRRIDEHYAPSAYRLLSETAEWLNSRGIEQWRNLLPYEGFLASVLANEVFGLFLGPDLAATVTLTPVKDEYWGDAQGKALYLHKLAVKRNYKGKNLGNHLLDWSIKFAQDAHCDFLRLDCIEENAVLRVYYAEHGFSPKGTASCRGINYALFEKDLRGP